MNIEVIESPEGFEVFQVFRYSKNTNARIGYFRRSAGWTRELVDDAARQLIELRVAI